MTQGSKMDIVNLSFYYHPTIRNVVRIFIHNNNITKAKIDYLKKYYNALEKDSCIYIVPDDSNVYLDFCHCSLSNKGEPKTTFDKLPSCRYHPFRGLRRMDLPTLKFALDLILDSDYVVKSETELNKCGLPEIDNVLSMLYKDFPLMQPHCFFNRVGDLQMISLNHLTNQKMEVYAIDVIKNFVVTNQDLYKMIELLKYSSDESFGEILNKLEDLEQRMDLVERSIATIERE